MKSADSKKKIAVLALFLFLFLQCTTAIASNNKNAISRGTIAEQSSITPTILEIFGIEVKPFSFDGESLASRDALQAKPAPGFDFISALAGAAILIFLLRS